MEKRHEVKVAAPQRVNATIVRFSPKIEADLGNLVLVKESGSTTYKESLRRKILHERWSGPWGLTEVLQRGLSVVK